LEKKGKLGVAENKLSIIFTTISPLIMSARMNKCYTECFLMCPLVFSLLLKETYRRHLKFEVLRHRWVPCHHGMACPQVADRGVGLQIWRVAANILNKESRTADKVWSSRLGVGLGANNSP
jgi:hypothetical protein